MIQLPRTDGDGVPYISYSQIKMWNETKGFNTGGLGRHEFIRSYFLGEDFPDKGGFAQFGTEVEGYITERKYAENFTEPEKKVMDSIQTLGVFQHEIKIPFDGFYVKGFIDDATEDFSIIRDYKTASNSSRKKYDEPDYYQLDLYGLYVFTTKGHIPDLEVCVIERIGNGFKGGRDVMRVGENIWNVKRATDLQRLETLEKMIKTTTNEISDYYKVFLKLNSTD